MEDIISYYYIIGYRDSKETGKERVQDSRSARIQPVNSNGSRERVQKIQLDKWSKERVPKRGGG